MIDVPNSGITDVHISLLIYDYLDCCVSDSSHPFAFGLTLESMHVQNHASGTQSSKRHNQQSQTETNTKIIQVHHFGFY